MKEREGRRRSEGKGKEEEEVKEREGRRRSEVKGKE